MSNWIKKGNIFNKEWAQLPIAEISENNRYYIIYYSTRDEQGRSIPKYTHLDKNFKCLTIQSINIPLGKPGSFDSHGVMPTDIITLEDGTKYLYYVGWSKRIDVPYWNSLGLAVSKDGGVTWKKYSEGPVLSSNSIDPNFIGTASIILPIKRKKYDTPWKMYYSSCKWEEINGKLEPIYGINIATSNNGMEWESDPVRFIKLSEETGGIAAFRKVGNKFYYSKRNKLDYRTNPKNSYKIYSFDLINEKEQLELDVEGDELMCAYPWIISEPDKDILIYNKDFGQGGLFYAERLKK